MHIVVITSHLNGIGRAPYAAVCDELAPTYAAGHA